MTRPNTSLPRPRSLSARRVRTAAAAIIVLGGLLGARYLANRPVPPEQLIRPETRALWDEPAGRERLLRATGRDLEQVRSPEDVRELFLEAPRLEPADYARLARFPQLEHLRIRGAAVSDAAARHIARQTTLRFLNLPQADLSDAGAAALAQLPELELLRLGSPRLSPAATEAFARMPKLRFLHLIDIPLTDAALEPLYELRQLESLYIDGAQLTDPGIESLLRALPEVHLHIDQQHHDRDPQRHDHAAANHS